MATAGVLVDGLSEHEYLEYDEDDDDYGRRHQHWDHPHLDIIFKY